MKNLKDVILESLLNTDTISDALKEKYNLIYNYETGRYDCDGDIKIADDLIENGHLRITFGTVKGEFDCIENCLSSLVGCPIRVDGDFICFDNRLKTLQGAPKYVGGGFFCDYNYLESLKGAPEEVGGHFACTGNPDLIYDKEHFYKYLPKIGNGLITDIKEINTQFKDGTIPEWRKI